ncbi:uncharacterized protein LOC143032146 [Oratosquilla oratoria]|uniref:uncharacterized protein LOC143032146 n=1 Tax=Oratosquilla oratoria TaxID=337810 RepID=UPI003F766D0F
MSTQFCAHYTALMAHVLLFLLVPSTLPVRAFFTSNNQDNLEYEVEDLTEELSKIKVEDYIPRSYGIEDYVPTPYGHLPLSYHKNRPVCHMIPRAVWQEAVIYQAWPTFETVTTSVTKTRWHTHIETVQYPVTVVSLSTVVLKRDVIVKTDTVCVPTSIYLVTPKFLTELRTLYNTFVKSLTVTATNYMTTTKFAGHELTVTRISSSFLTSIVPTTVYTTIWSKEVETVTRPVYVTTELLVKAPELRVVTSTMTETNYLKSTQYVTAIVKESVCQKQYETQSY